MSKEKSQIKDSEKEKKEGTKEVIGTANPNPKPPKEDNSFWKNHKDAVFTALAFVGIFAVAFFISKHLK